VKESKVLGLTGLSSVDKTLPDTPTITETRSEENDGPVGILSFQHPLSSLADPGCLSRIQIFPI
jgi:hypothetical protein